MRGDDGYGLWKVRNLMIYDLTSLCGFEPLLWDAWGVMLLQPPGVPPMPLSNWSSSMRWQNAQRFFWWY